MKDAPLNGRARPGPRAALAVLLATLVIAACETTGGGGPLPERVGVNGQPGAEAPDNRQAVVDNLLTPPHRASGADQLVRVGLLLPFSSPAASVRADANAMFNAAQLALFESHADRVVLIPKDTGGTPDGARRQARETLRQGADVILGPLSAEAARVVADEASVYDKPVIAFTDDRSVAETGAYLLSVTPEEEITRVVSFATRREIFDFAALTPDNAYGFRVQNAAEQAAQDNGGLLVTSESYPEGGDSAMAQLPARRLARYDSRQAFEAQAEAEADEGEEPEEFELPYQAVILPEGGVRLLSIAPLLPYFDVDPRLVRFLGTSLWNDPDVAREPSLAGGWFPGPDSDATATFAASYSRVFGAEPTRAAPLAYDGVLAIASLTRGFGAAGLSPEGLERESGFHGADGLFRFGSDRVAEHALAIYEVRGGGFRVIDPAPQTFTPQAF